MMPNRIIREGLLDSARYWSVTIEARQLFFHLLLLADDLGCVQLAPVFVRRRCFDDRPADSKVAKLLEELNDADLVRSYTANGAQYGFVPRFRQRLQRQTLRHPPPPAELLQGDADAEEKFLSVRDLRFNPSVGQPLPTDPQPPEVKKKGSEVKKTSRTAVAVLSHDEPEGSPEPSRHPVLDCPVSRIVDAYHETLPTLPRVRILTDARRAALRARWREMAAADEFKTEAEGLAWFRKFFGHVGESSFLLGNSPRRPGSPHFLADLEWLMKSGNFAKVIEGKYHHE